MTVRKVKDGVERTLSVPLSAIYGGTGQTSYSVGDIVYSSATDTISKLSGNTTTTKKMLTQTGSGSASAAPSWDTVTKSDVGLGNVENTSISTWAGSTNLTTGGNFTANGTLSASGSLSINSGKFTVNSITGDAYSDGTIAAAANLTVGGYGLFTGFISTSSSLDVNSFFTVNGSNGSVTSTGSFFQENNFYVNTDKFTVAHLSGNTVSAGTSRATSFILSGSTSGTVTVSSPAVSGSNTITLPAGTTDFSSTGGTSQFVKQNSAGGAFTVSQVGVSDLSGFGSGVATFLGTPSSANLASAVTGETGSGALVFGTSPAITTSLTTPSTTFSLLNTTATTINFGGAATNINMGANDVSVNILGRIELGKRGVSNTTYIDFHSGSIDADYDARFSCSGGNGSIGGGDLSVNSASFSANCPISTSSSILSSSSSGGIGYKTGAGGSVTQTTSKDTNVTINKICGLIIMHNQALAAGAKVSFYVFNSNVSSTDIVVVSARDGFSGAYMAQAYLIANGAFAIRVENTSGSSHSEAAQINFTVIKSAIS